MLWTSKQGIANIMSDLSYMIMNCSVKISIKRRYVKYQKEAINEIQRNNKLNFANSELKTLKNQQIKQE